MAKINIPGRLHSVETGNIVTGADEVYDDNMELKQQAINQQVDEAVTQLESSTTAMAERIEQVAHMKDKSVGLYSTLASLQAAHPTPEVGDWALVGDADPFAVYECSTAGTWAATGGTYSAGEIDLADYTTKAEFDELDAVVNGGSSETPATTTWTESGKMINYATGAEMSNSTAYAASDFIQIPNGTSSIRLWALVIKPGGSFSSVCGIAFYDASQNYVSGIQREEYDHGGTAVPGMAERTYNVPSGARYLRVTCTVSQEGNWYCYFQSSTGSGLVGRMNDAELNIDAAAELAQEAYALAEDAGQIQPSHDVYRHATDPDAPTNLNSAQRGRATYTTVFGEDKKFNQFIIKSVKASAANTSVSWRLNVFANTNTNYDYIPVRGDGLKGTTLKSGVVTVGDTAADVVVDLGEDITCPAGSQVIIYMIAANEATLQLGRVSTVQDDTHGQLTNSTGDFSGTWYNAYPSVSINYSTCAPVLRYESAIMSREEVEDLVDDKLAEAGIDNTPTHVVYQHATDPENPVTKSRSVRGIAAYTGSFDESAKFNAVIVKSVSAVAEDTQIEWRVYVNATTGRSYDDIPLNSHPVQGTMVASGTATVGTKAQNLTLSFDAATCHSGSQIIVYLLNTATTATISAGVPTTYDGNIGHGLVSTSGSDWSSNWAIGYPDNGYRMCAPVIMWLSANVSREEVVEIVDEEIASSAIGVDKLKITLANDVYCLVGSEINLYAQHVSMPNPNGNTKPTNFIVQWRTLAGHGSVKRTEQGVRIRPTAAGQIQLKITLQDQHDNLLDEKTITIYAVAKDALTTAKNILFVGDSWVQAWCGITYNILRGTDTYNDAEGETQVRFTGTCPNFLGTMPVSGVSPHSEGRGGWTWKSFAYADDPVVDPGGDIDTEGTNPFWNPSTGKIDIAYYRNKLGMGNEHFDLVMWHLGGNDITRLRDAKNYTVEEYEEKIRTSIVPYMDTIVKAVVDDNPDAIQMLFQMGFYDRKWVGYDGEAAYNTGRWEGVKSTYAYNLVQKEWVDAYNAELGTQKVVLSNACVVYDPFYSMQMKMIPICDRWAKEKKGGRELVGSNVVHPSGVGYGQMADELAAEIAGRLGNLNTTNHQIGYQKDGYYGNADEVVVNGKGLQFDTYLTTTVQPIIGTLTDDVRPWYVYDSRNNRFLARSKSTYSYHTTFSAQNTYMTDGHPKADVIYWLGDVPYMYNGTTLVRLSEFIANVTARLAALENG